MGKIVGQTGLFILGMATNFAHAVELVTACVLRIFVYKK